MKKAFANYCKNIARKASKSKVAVMTAATMVAGSTFAEGFNPTAAATEAATSVTGIVGIVATAGITVALAYFAVRSIKRA